MNINQINALRKVASAYEEAYWLEKEAAFNAAALKGAFNTAKGAITGAAKRTGAAFKHGGMQGGLKSLKRQGMQAGKAIAGKWNGLSRGAQAGITAAGGALAGAGLAGLAGRGGDEEQGSAPTANYR